LTFCFLIVIAGRLPRWVKKDVRHLCDVIEGFAAEKDID
jgi:hypothetical protein